MAYGADANSTVTLIVIGSTFKQNVATDGGAIYYTDTLVNLNNHFIGNVHGNVN